MNRDDRDAQRDANHDDRDANTATTATQWLSVAVTARRVGVSPRAIQRRCQSGKYHARRVNTPKGEVWEVDEGTLESTATPTATTATLDRADADDNRDARHDDRDATATISRDDADVTPAPASTISDQRAADFAARYVAQIEAENRFLKSQIEEGNRNAAELRKALNEALRIAPRQLTQGTATNAQNQPAAPYKRPDDQTATTNESDGLGVDELSELCRRVFESKR